MSSRYGRNADGTLIVLDWGRPNGTHLVDSLNGRFVETACWNIFWVDAYIRGLPCGRQGTHSEHQGWVYYSTYAVRSWSDVRAVFDCYLGTGGYYQRVSFHVEEWLWTREEGWEWDDRV